MTCAAMFSRPDQASNYSLHRPRYPPELYDAILAHCPGRALAVDIATGSGQAAAALAGHFERVIGQDGSAEQLQQADRQHSNIDYQHADAHSTGLPDHCADLVTVAQALHWFDQPRFYREVRRVLKPGGCFAAWMYGLPTLCHKGHPANEVMWHLYDTVLGGHWAAGRKHVEAEYVGIEPVIGQDFSTVERFSFETTRTAHVNDVVGYIKSWSAYHAYKEEHPHADPIEDFQQALLKALGAQDGSSTLEVVLTITLVLATGPVPVPSAS